MLKPVANKFPENIFGRSSLKQRVNRHASYHLLEHLRVVLHGGYMGGYLGGYLGGYITQIGSKILCNSNYSSFEKIKSVKNKLRVYPINQYAFFAYCFHLKQNTSTNQTGYPPFLTIPLIPSNPACIVQLISKMRVSGRGVLGGRVRG
jgi:hypothetical protein